MPYSTSISGLDISGGLADVRVTAGYTFSVVTGPHPGEQRQDEVNLDIPSNSFSSTTPIGYAHRRRTLCSVAFDAAPTTLQAELLPPVADNQQLRIIVGGQPTICPVF